MRKAILVPASEKKDQQILQDMARSPQERVDFMFDLIRAMSRLQKEYIHINKPGSIILKRKR
uniref:Uncharacterized protein n=1 Tax=uncultured bacterium BLR19 TaxID=506519 RepID=C0INZ0_9BACT|nr:hypothetical protein AKSOIL_0318 [uncultured bacterium BLR19]